MSPNQDGPPMVNAGGRRSCSFEGCPHPHKARGYCRGHYEQKKAGRELSPVLVRDFRTRYWLQVEKTQEGCWEWTGTKTHDGYGRIFDQGKPFYAHRISWGWAKGGLSPSTEVDHLCHNRACVKPAHLRESTRSQNNQNRSGPQSNSTTGIRGVYREGKKYKAQARLNRETHYLGIYETKDEAAAVVSAWRREHMPYSLMDQSPLPEQGDPCH